ncbi:MAG: hypothetical protein KGL39_33305 [Patescibacteria group bacterium]|nr:hypothetical protein [Patescibacteria group bacterium]
MFTKYEVKTDKSAKETAAAIIKSLQSAPEAFQVTLADSPQPETYRIVAKQDFSLGILGGTERRCLMVVGQAKDDETQVWFKVLEFQVQHTIEANGLFNVRDDKQYIPIAPGRVQMNDILRNRIQQGVRLMLQKIDQATGA